MFVYTTTLVCLLAGLVCSNGNLSKPSFVQQPLTTFSCNPYLQQHAPKLVCSVSGIASSTHKLSWSTTSQHSDTILAAVQVHRQRNGCFIMTSTLHLAEPVVSHIGQHWCVLSSPNKTFLLQSSSFSLLSPAHYSHKPACKHPDHSRQLETRDITENNSSSGDGGDLIPGGVIAAVVIVVVMVVVGGAILVPVLIFGCMYMMHRKQPPREETGPIDKKTVEESETSINYISYSEIESKALKNVTENGENGELENTTSGYQALSSNTRDYLSVYTMLKPGRDRVTEADSLPRTHTGSMERRKRGFPIRKPKDNAPVTGTLKKAVRNPSAHRIRHTYTSLAYDDKQLAEED